MIVGIHQPAYLPWLGYFDRIARVDVFIYLDTVQFQKGSFQNRNKVLCGDKSIWLTVPVQTAGKLYTNVLKDVGIDASQDWQSRHIAALQQGYRKAPLFGDIMDRLEPFYSRSWTHLSELCWEMLLSFNDLLGVKTRIVKASDLGDVEGRKSDLVLNLCRAVGVNHYLSGSQGRDYLDLASFAEAGISVEFQKFTPEPYPQQSPSFVAALGCVDYLFNVDSPERLFQPAGVPGMSGTACDRGV